VCGSFCRVDKIQNGGHCHGNQGAKIFKFIPNFKKLYSNVSCHMQICKQILSFKMATVRTAAILNFFNPPKSCHTLQWIFLQSFMKFDERNPKNI
jgi:hypothetical protein